MQPTSVESKKLFGKGIHGSRLLLERALNSSVLGYKLLGSECFSMKGGAIMSVVGLASTFQSHGLECGAVERAGQ